MLSHLAEETFEALPDRSLGVANIGVERGEIRKLARPSEKLEEAARRRLRLETPIHAEPLDLCQRLIEAERREEDVGFGCRQHAGLGGGAEHRFGLGRN